MGLRHVLSLLLVVLVRPSLAAPSSTFALPRVLPLSADALVRVLARAQALRKNATRHPEAVAAAVAAAVFMLPPTPVSAAPRLAKALAPEAHAFLAEAIDLVASIRGMGVAADCSEQQGLVGRPGRGNYLIAANLNNAYEIMPVSPSLGQDTKPWSKRSSGVHRPQPARRNGPSRQALERPRQSPSQQPSACDPHGLAALTHAVLDPGGPAPGAAAAGPQAPAGAPRRRGGRQRSCHAHR
jgi:hypothetical protein